jgi:hypothetical protein
MASLGKLTLLGSPTGIFEFILVHFPDGWMNEQLENVVEEITAGGTNGTRMRVIRTDYRKFRLQAIADFETFEDAVAFRNEAFICKGRVCTLEVTVDAVVYTFPRKIFVWDVSAVPSPASIVAAVTLVADSAGQALVSYDFTLQATSEPITP